MVNQHLTSNHGNIVHVFTVIVNGMDVLGAGISASQYRAGTPKKKL